jgi:hypothetical protein
MDENDGYFEKLKGKAMKKKIGTSIACFLLSIISMAAVSLADAQPREQLKANPLYSPRTIRQQPCSIGVKDQHITEWESYASPYDEIMLIYMNKKNKQPADHARAMSKIDTMLAGLSKTNPFRIPLYSLKMRSLLLTEGDQKELASIAAAMVKEQEMISADYKGKTTMVDTDNPLLITQGIAKLKDVNEDQEKILCAYLDQCSSSTVVKVKANSYLDKHNFYYSSNRINLDKSAEAIKHFFVLEPQLLGDGATRENQPDFFSQHYRQMLIKANGFLKKNRKDLAKSIVEGVQEADLNSETDKQALRELLK